MNKPKTYSPEVRERAVRMVFEHEHEHTSQWAAIQSIAEKIGCSGETLRNWVRQAERDQGKRGGLSTDERSTPLNPQVARGQSAIPRQSGFVPSRLHP